MKTVCAICQKKLYGKSHIKSKATGSYYCFPFCS